MLASPGCAAIGSHRCPKATNHVHMSKFALWLVPCRDGDSRCGGAAHRLPRPGWLAQRLTDISCLDMLGQRPVRGAATFAVSGIAVLSTVVAKHYHRLETEWDHEELLQFQRLGFPVDSYSLGLDCCMPLVREQPVVHRKAARNAGGLAAASSTSRVGPLFCPHWDACDPRDFLVSVGSEQIGAQTFLQQRGLNVDAADVLCLALPAPMFELASRGLWRRLLFRASWSLTRRARQHGILHPFGACPPLAWAQQVVGQAGDPPQLISHTSEQIHDLANVVRSWSSSLMQAARGEEARVGQSLALDAVVGFLESHAHAAAARRGA